MTIFFSKYPKNPILGNILDPFCPNLSKNEISWNKELCQFLNITIIYHRAKNQKKLIGYSWEKCQTGRQTDNIIGPFPITKVTLSFPEFISTHQKPVWYINFFMKYS